MYFRFYFWNLGLFYLEFLPSILVVKLENSSVDISIASISKNVFIYLGIPFCFRFFKPSYFDKGKKGNMWYEERFLEAISPITLISLLFTIFMMCSYKSDVIFSLPLDALRIALPLTLYFVCMFFFSWFISRKSKID